MIAMNRRGFAAGLAASAPLLLHPGRASAAIRPTARVVVDRIRARCAAEGVTWNERTVDTFKLGDPDRPISGIACTFMATLETLRRTARAGANFVVSHEPVFYNHYDDTTELVDDPVYTAKTAFAREHGIVVWRFHDHLHQLKPEPMGAALISRLGWERYRDPASSGLGSRFTRPPLRLDGLVREIARRLPTRSIRYVGDPALPVTRIGMGGHFITELVAILAGCDVAMFPEVREWDCAEYVRDAIALGQRKAVIMLAHERGEENGMARCANWLRPLVPEVPVLYLPTGEPFRRANEA